MSSLTFSWSEMLSDGRGGWETTSTLRSGGWPLISKYPIVANILLQIIPTTSGEKRAFTYYRDGAI